MFQDGRRRNLHFYQSTWSMHSQPATEVIAQLPVLLYEGKRGDLGLDVSRFQDDLLHHDGSGLRRSSGVFQVSGSQRTSFSFLLDGKIEKTLPF